MKDEQPLPPDWTKRFSNTKNRDYYFNTRTKESRWTRPDEPVTNGESSQRKRLSDGPSNEQSKKSRTGEIRASHLLVKHKDSRNPSSWKESKVTRTKEEAAEMVEEFRKRIEDGEITFAELATTESHCGSHKAGGDLGFFGKGKMQKPFEEAAFALSVNEMSDLVYSDSGVHIILRTA
eukprot:TRINITY_DN3645_c0_g1_i1.p1 TRINITY_DN3645_c0_g1~~TRINITY_DN3645_c0_g1_i1.p1  ORF type:complete len:191 (+),score=43.72 TRINITY_DN3645_c0_g1_i1:42-575(+)